MARLDDTAYPRLKSHPTRHDLAAVYTPTWEEVALANETARGTAARICFLVLLKTYQRLGYPIFIADVPTPIVEHIAHSVNATTPVSSAGYDDSGTRKRHLATIRAHLQVRPWGAPARRVMLGALREAARTKYDLAALINVAIEELVRQRYELPAFSTLDRAAGHVRAVAARALYRQVAEALSPQAQATIDGLFIADLTTRRTPWNDLKAEPRTPTIKHLKELLARHGALAARNVGAAALGGVPQARVQHLAAEAMTLDAARMAALEPRKRYTLAAALLATRTAQALDDLGTMFVRQMRRIHSHGKEALARYRVEAAPRTDALVLTLRDLVVAHGQEGTDADRFAAMDAVISGHGGDVLLEECDAHLAHAGSNYYPFLWRPYRSHRATLLALLRRLPLDTTTQDTAVVEAVRFLLAHASRTGATLPTVRRERAADGTVRLVPLLDLSWIPDGWWRLVTRTHARHAYPERVDRRHFEACVCSQVLWELSSGDLCIVGSDQFADYGAQLVSWAEYDAGIREYGRLAGVPVDSPAFVAHVRDWLEGIAQETDRAFPANKAVRIEDGEPVITRPAPVPPPAGLPALETLLAARVEPVGLLDALAATEHWLHWTRFFGPISGFDAKIDDPVARYLATVFCYGTNIGPVQLARSLEGIEFRQLLWINQRHISEETLDRAIARVVEAYRRFTLPKCWGSATRVSADGTQWELYENNLLGERHIRYGSYGGIGYYHVAGDYIALFSRFIPCGVLEGVYILDPFFAHKDDDVDLPEAVHSDTHGQSAPIFGLAYLLGIDLMPRIRNWKDLTWCRPSPTSQYAHIDGLFTDTIDWDLIATHMPDMLRVALSIKEGRLTPSTILRRLGTYSRKNRLYHAFRELGRAVRTGFLLRFLADGDLRATIQAAMNKSESFNQYAQWVAFGGEGLIAEHERAAQRKIVKYNQLLANCLIFYTVAATTRALAELQDEGYPVDADALAALSPYTTAHFNRFGRYHLDLTRVPPALDYDAPILSPDPRHKSSEASPS
ncbi:MAG: Tn3 family transposase [Chloroflexota bacterium]